MLSNTGTVYKILENRSGKNQALQGAEAAWVELLFRSGELGEKKVRK